ncbi:uncharacterized protein LOC127868927 isoform X5 [Dreissena polymorpha]|uniref:uncharacterized protein LOC127868927 isoform X5 n=1 Tax=Dreissena polymorpha TaxID=45954 RepID=UPI0022649D58|nr:uncharacterized protein LOC127868927 isoform X5 [Dreissena polymorpha]
MSSETVAKVVGKKLRHYFEVKRLEDGFDLSGVNQPQLNHPPLKSLSVLVPPTLTSPYRSHMLRRNDPQRATLQYDGLHDRALKHYFSQAEVKTRITQMHPTDGELREDDIKRLLKRYMYKYRFIPDSKDNNKLQIKQPQKVVGFDLDPSRSGHLSNRKTPWQPNVHNKHPTMPEWMYRHHPTQGRAIKAELVGFGVGLPSQKHKRIKGGFPQMRTVPSRSITRGEAQRLIDVATKILVATEHVNNLQARPVTPNHKKQAAPKPFETNQNLPDGKSRKKKRPSTAKYTWDIHGRRHIRVKSYDDSFVPDWLIHEMQHDLATGEYLPYVPYYLEPYDKYGPEPNSQSFDNEPHILYGPISPGSQFIDDQYGQNVQESHGLNDTAPCGQFVDDQYSQYRRGSRGWYRIVPFGQINVYRSDQNSQKSFGPNTKGSHGQLVDDRYDTYTQGSHGWYSPKSWLLHSSVPLDDKHRGKRTQRRDERKQKEAESEEDEPATPKPSPRPKSAKYRQREPDPSPPRPTVINVPETPMSKQVAVNQGSQTVDDVGIQTERKLLEEYDHSEEEVKDGPWCEYQVYVRTGDRVGAATKADVKITLYGEKGRTKEITLGKSSQNKVKFQRGKEDIFVFPAHHVGKLRKIKIGHDRPELNYAWYVDSVSVSDMHDKRIYDFPCHTWLSGRDGDKKTYKEFTLDGERAFVEAFNKERERSYPSAGRDRNKGDDSSESKASKNDKGSQESLRGSRGEGHSDDESTRSHSSRSTSSMSSSSSSRGRRTPAKVTKREISPPRKTEKDEFFDSKVSGPTFTFRNSKDETTDPEEYLSGYKAGLEAASAEQKHQHSEEDRAKKRVLDGVTIHDAARTGDMDRMQKLLDNFPDMKESKDEAGLTPLHIASTHGRLDIVKWLTALGVNLNTETQTGYTAIHLAASNGHLNCIIVLAAMGAKLTCLSVDKQTPLHLAAMNGHLECVKWLIANRANLSAKDNQDRSALELAEEYQQKEVAAFIRKCLDEEKDPNSSLHSLRKSRNGLGTIQEDSRTEGSSLWRDDSNAYSSRATAGSQREGRNARESNAQSAKNFIQIPVIWRSVDCTRNNSKERSVHTRLSWTAYVTRWQSNGHSKEHYPAIFGPTELEQ